MVLQSSWVMPVLKMFPRSLIYDSRSIIDDHKGRSKLWHHSLTTLEASFVYNTGHSLLLSFTGEEKKFYGILLQNFVVKIKVSRERERKN
jgi:hypothetical protein